GWTGPSTRSPTPWPPRWADPARPPARRRPASLSPPPPSAAPAPARGARCGIVSAWPWSADDSVGRGERDTREAMTSSRRRLLAAGAAGAALPLARRALGDWAPSQRIPDPAVVILDDAFKGYRIGSAKIERLATGFRWCEGPVWFGDGRYVLFSDIPNNRIMKWEEETGAVSVFRKPSSYTNGNARDRHGRLVSCEHDSRRVTRTELDGTITVVADRFEGKRLNSPNDIVCRSDGSIWFSDPPFGILGNYEGHEAKPELPTNVYRIDPATSRLDVVAGDIARPNGLCFSPDERRLHVIEAGVT